MEIVKHPEWKELFDAAQHWDYGTEHDHDEISSIISLQKETQKYYQAVGRTNKELRKQAQKHLVCIQGKGYRVLKPDEFLTEAGRFLKQAVKRIGKSYEVAYATPVHLLTDEQRTRWTGFVERGLRLKAMADAERQELRRIADGKAKIAVNGETPRMF
jgi:hypothetical protein